MKNKTSNKILKSQYRKPLFLIGLFFFAGIFLFNTVYAQYFGGKFFRKSKKGVVVQGTISQRPRDGKVYAEVEAFPAGRTRIDFVILKDGGGNTYQPLSMQKVSKSQLQDGQEGWPPQSLGITNTTFTGVGQDFWPPPPLPEEPGTVTLCTYQIDKSVQGPFSVTVGVSDTSAPLYVESQVVIDTSLDIAN